MSKLKMWVVSILAVLILGGGGWTAYQAIAQKNSLNHAYAFAYKTKDRMSWFEISENKGKVTGHLNEKYIEEVRWDPQIYKNNLSYLAVQKKMGMNSKSHKVKKRSYTKFTFQEKTFQ